MLALKKYSFYVESNKCFFSIQLINFLKYIIILYGVKIKPNRVLTIIEWLASNNFRKLQVFLNFVNFYKKFIYTYLKTAGLLLFLLFTKFKKVKKNKSKYKNDELKLNYKKNMAN